MNIRYRVTLTADERSQLAALVQEGKAAVRRIKRARILLAADARTSDEAIAASVSPRSIAARQWSVSGVPHMFRTQDAQAAPFSRADAQRYCFKRAVTSAGTVLSGQRFTADPNVTAASSVLPLAKYKLASVTRHDAQRGSIATARAASVVPNA
jgi:hypothetical protein